MVLAALATTALFVVLFVYPGLMIKSNKTAVTPHVDGSPLQLRVAEEWSGRGIVLRPGRGWGEWTRGDGRPACRL